MRKLILLIASVFVAILVKAHSVDVNQIKLHNWTLNDRTVVQGSFLMMKDNHVFIEKNDGSVVHYPLSSLTLENRELALKRYKAIEELNTETTYVASPPAKIQWFRMALTSAFLLSVSLGLYLFAGKRFKLYISYFTLIGVTAVLYSFSKASFKQLASTTSPAFVDSAFTPFKPNVVTSWDSVYFYVESKGIPTTHEMMAGISNHGWQQQVPIPQCYLLPNAWPIPLNPVMASNPIPVDSIHFTRGAIAIAVNGVPIFNVHTNTGVDSYVDGQLDSYGGHCGRADDYHYHIAPLHLYAYTSASQPIAFGLDGFAVYGSQEPDGSAMQPLDNNHGHYGTDGIYHYHGTNTAPYMIANMAGQVTEDNTHQLIPQAAAHPIRPSRTPLSGALITSCVPNANNNGFLLTYTKSGQTYQIDYNWDSIGNYTFHYISPSGTSDSLYHGFTQCQLPVVSGVEPALTLQNGITIYPNPASGEFAIRLHEELQANDIQNTAIYSLQGKLLFSDNNFKEVVKTNQLPAGVYLLVLQTNKGTVSRKIAIQ